MLYSQQVSPLGYPRVAGYRHLSAAFRSLSRPSSPLDAKASTRYLLLLNFYSAKPLILIIESCLYVEMIGLEPTTSCVQSMRSTR
jgi:hypothetical protein